MSITPSDPVPADFDGSALEEWIAGATVAKRSVPIYGKPSLYAEYEQLEREHAKAKEQAEYGVEMAGSDIKRIEARMRDLYEEWIASKSTWTLHALTDERIEELRKAEPELIEPTEPTAPDPLPANHNAQQAKSHTIAKNEHEKALRAYAEATAKYAQELNLRVIAASVERIEFADGRASDGVTVDQLRTLRERLGERQLLSLATAASLARMSEPEIPAPFSRATSEDDPTSS